MAIERIVRGCVAAIAALVMTIAGGQAFAQIQEFSWNQDQPTVVMRPVASHWCFLTDVRGKLRGFGEEVRVEVRDNKWVLTGRSAQQGVSGKANCLPTTMLLSKGPARMVSIPAFARKWGTDECNKNPIRAWWGDAATAISGIGGDFQGSGEWISVEQSMNPKSWTVGYSHTCRSQAYAALTSYFIGTPEAGRLARFAGPGGLNLTADKAGEFAIASGGGTRMMAPVKQAICYFTFIGGDFEGGGEGVRIFQQGDNWVMRAESKSGGGTKARARCLMLDQRS